MLLKTKLFFLRKSSLCSYLNNEQPPRIFPAFLWAHLLNENSSNLIFFILLCKCFVHNSLCFFTCSISVFHPLTFIEYVLFSRCKGRARRENKECSIYAGGKRRRRKTQAKGEKEEREGEKTDPGRKPSSWKTGLTPELVSSMLHWLRCRRAEELTLALPAGQCLSS